jgi:Type II secretion system (T2SS), protein E, N-terminal domain
MSAAEMPLELKRMQTKRTWISLADHVREFFAWRCAGADCPQRGRLWPAWARLHRTTGIQFDGNWYCCVFCLEPVVEMQVRHLLAGYFPERPKVYRHTMGSLLVHRGVISRDDLREALRLQRETAHRRLGDCLREMRLVTEEQLASALGQQWGCPVFPLEQRLSRSAYIDLLPVHLLEAAHAVPAHVSPDGGTLHVAFADRLDHTMLYAVGVMLGCRTFGCVATESAIALALDDLRHASGGNETCFETIRDPREITRTICSYADELRTLRATMVRVARYIWVRLHSARSCRDLLFRLLSGAPSVPTEPNVGTPKDNSAFADIGKDGVPVDARHPK